MRFTLLALLGLLCTFPVGAQSTATIIGRVSDSSGAVLSSAQVTARNTATGLERTVRTSESGDYEFPLLPITGSYSLIVTKEGFKTNERTGIELQVQQQARFDIVLDVGNISEKITVEASAPIVNTETGSIGQVIENKKIVDLPLNGRNFVQLASLLPNAVVGTSGTVGGTTVAVSGGRANKTEYLLDGISINEQLFDGVILRPSVDAIQEFKLQSNSFSAEYGRGNAVLNATIKSGTNNFHGTLFEFLRNDKMDARNFFLANKAPYRQNQFGFAVGGPVMLPKFSGKDKSFFFLNYEGTRIRQGRTFNALVPSAAFRRGDFSSLSTPIRDPLTGENFPGNIIPANRINPATSYFLQFMPAQNTSTGTFAYAAPFRNDQNQGNARYDHIFSSKDSLAVRYSINHLEAFNPGAYLEVGGSNQRQRAQNLVLTETHIFSASTINELRLGYTRMFNANLNQGLGTNYTVQAGIGGFAETSQNFPGFPQLSITGYQGISGNAFQPLVNPTNMYQIVDSLSWIKGTHTIKIGADLRNYRLTSTNSANSRGAFSFNGIYTGNAFADYLTGYPTSGSRSFPRNLFGLTENRYHFYVQDDWKVARNLTLNLGLRYELNLQPVAMFGQSANFNFDTGRWAVSTYNGQINTVSQQVAQYALPRYQNLVDKATDLGLPNNLRYNNFKDFAPRVGIAWRPFGDNKTVFRTGAGIFYLLTSGNNAVSAPIINVPFIVDESKQQPVVNGRPTLAVQNFFDPFSSQGNFATPLTFGFNPRMRTPRMYQWNFAIQRELTNSLALEVAYVGNKGTFLERYLPTNLARVSSTDLRPFQDRRPFPQFGTGSFYDSADNSSYNALEAKLEQRYQNGLTFLAAYSWSKSLDSSSNDSGETVADPFNLRTMRGLSALDVGQRFVLSFGWELPFGRGRAMGSDMPALADAIVGGWQLGGIWTIQGGFPFTPTISSADPANVAFSYARRPDRIGSGKVDECRAEQCFNIADFRVPQPYTIGNSGRNILRGPGIHNWDLSIFKNFRFTESVNLQFRAEAFNAFNHTQFNNPNANIDLPTQGGRIFSAKDPRIGQVALKLYF